MKLYKKAEVKMLTYELLERMLDCSQLKFSTMQHNSPNEFVTSFGLGRQSGHTTAIQEWVKNAWQQLGPTEYVVVVLKSSPMVDFYNKALWGDKLSRTPRVIIVLGDNHSFRLRASFFGRDVTRVTILGDNVSMNDIYEVYSDIASANLNSKCEFRAVCLQPCNC